VAEKEFRDAVLAGAVTEQDTPPRRAEAAAAYYDREAQAAAAAEASAAAAVDKAEAQLAAARDAVGHAKAARVAADEARAMGARLLADVKAGADISQHLGPAPGQDVTVNAGVAGGTGKARS
jgi:hypothetical protein